MLGRWQGNGWGQGWLCVDSTAELNFRERGSNGVARRGRDGGGILGKRVGAGADLLFNQKAGALSAAPRRRRWQLACQANPFLPAIRTPQVHGASSHGRMAAVQTLAQQPTSINAQPIQPVGRGRHTSFPIHTVVQSPPRPPQGFRSSPSDEPPCRGGRTPATPFKF